VTIEARKVSSSPHIRVTFLSDGGQIFLKHLFFMRYLPYQSLGDKSNIIVGGNANSSTVLNLTPDLSGNTPDSLQSDLCCKMAFKLLAQEPEFAAAEVVSSDFFNTDNLAAIFALTRKGLAASLVYELDNIAQAAMYEKTADQNMARVAFVLSAWMDPTLSPLNQTVFNSPPLAITNVLYEELLPRLPNIIERVDYLERYWFPASACFEATENAIATGGLKLTEIEALDLVIVESDEPAPTHSMSIHNRTDCTRVMLLGAFENSFYFRRESVTGSRLAKTNFARINLSPLASRLTRYEVAGGSWKFDPITDGKPYLRFTGTSPSQIKKESFKTALLEVLSNVV